MATIKRRSGKYQVAIRRNGYPLVYKTFTSLSIVRKWIMVTEADMERQLFQATSDVTVNKILMRYSRQRCSLPRSEAKPGATRAMPRINAIYLLCISVISYCFLCRKTNTSYRLAHKASRSRGVGYADGSRIPTSASSA